MNNQQTQSEQPHVEEKAAGNAYTATSGSEQDILDMDIVFGALCFCLRGDEPLGDFFDDLPENTEEHGEFDKAIIDIQRLKMKGWCLDQGYNSDDFKTLWDKIYSEKFPNVRAELPGK